jgi:hypothetical protein
MIAGLEAGKMLDARRYNDVANVLRLGDNAGLHCDN